MKLWRDNVRKFVLFAFVALMMLSGCTEQVQIAPNMTQVNQSEAGSASIVIKNFAFDPAAITISKGTTVIWMNKDSVSHTVSGTGFESGTLPPGQSYNFTFTEPGSFSYHCSIHTTMKGTVVVQ